jgi:hypothetical protein
MGVAMTIAIKGPAGRPTSAIRNEYMTTLQAICGEPSLLPSEDREAYCALRDAIAAGVSPRDGVEAMWVQDITEITWEGWRRKKLKPAFVRVAIPHALAEIFKSAGKYNEASRLAAEYVNGGSRERKRIEAQLATMGFGAVEIHAKAYELTVDELYQLDRLDAVADGRRIAIFREIDRHRAYAAAQAVNPPPMIEQIPPKLGGGSP